MSDNELRFDISNEDFEGLSDLYSEQNIPEKIDSDETGQSSRKPSNSENIDSESKEKDMKKRKSASPARKEENKRRSLSRSSARPENWSPRPSSSRRRSPSKDRTPSRRTSSASSSIRTSRRPAGLYNSKRGTKNNPAPKDDTPNKYYMDYSVYNVDYPKEMPNFNLQEEEHFVFMATDWPQDLIDQAEGIIYVCRPNATIDELAKEIIDVIENRDISKRLYITAPIFDKFLTTLLPEGIEKVVDRISAHIKDPREDWLKHRTPYHHNIFKVYLTYPTIPYRPALEHYWPEICEVNQFLKNETISLYSTPVNTNKWLTKPYKGDCRQKEVLGNMYTEYAETKTGLGYTLTYNAKRKINNAIISHHVTGVRNYRAGSLAIETPPVPLDITSGYRICVRNRSNGWIQPIMGAMWATLKLRDEERQYQAEAKIKADHQAKKERERQREQVEKERRREQEREQQQEKERARQENEERSRQDEQKDKGNLHERVARNQEKEKEKRSSSIKHHPKSDEDLVAIRDREIEQLKAAYDEKSNKLRVVSSALLHVKAQLADTQTKREEEMDAYTVVVEKYDAVIAKAEDQEHTIHRQDKQLRRDSKTLVHLRENEIRQDTAIQNLKTELESIKQELKVEKELTAALQKQKASSGKKSSNKETEKK